MRVIIIEDELPAANRLSGLLEKSRMPIEIVAKLDSVESAVNYLKTTAAPDLIFMDIQLADGLCFNIFEEVSISTPVIFTTAFDQYTLKAFKVNSIDYLLKPIDARELENAIEKYRQIHAEHKLNLSDTIAELMKGIQSTRYKERILIKRGQQFNYLKTENIAFGYADGKLCYVVDFLSNKHLLEINLTQLEEQLDPLQFYRVNRTLLININSIQKLHTWLGGRLKLELNVPAQTDTIVSRERVNGLKEWLGGNK